MQISVTSIYNTIGNKHQLFVMRISDHINVRMQEAVARTLLNQISVKAVINLINGCVSTILYSDDYDPAIKNHV